MVLVSISHTISSVWPAREQVKLRDNSSLLLTAFAWSLFSPQLLRISWRFAFRTVKFAISSPADLVMYGVSVFTQFWPCLNLMWSRARGWNTGKRLLTLRALSRFRVTIESVKIRDNYLYVKFYCAHFIFLEWSVLARAHLARNFRENRDRRFEIVIASVI